MLAIPTFRWNACSDSLGSAPPASAIGTNFSFGANSSDGSSVSVLSALAHDVQFLVIGIAGSGLAGADTNSCVDILIDPAGGTSWLELISDLVCGIAPPLTTLSPLAVWYYFPLCVMAGSSLGVRAKTLHTSDITAGRIAIWAFGQPSRPDMWWCGSKVETLGAVAGAYGASIQSGSNGSWGSWTTVGASTVRYGAVQFGVNASDATANNNGYFWQLGVGGAQVPGTPTQFVSASNTENSARSGVQMPIFASIPAGTTLQMRGMASGTGGEAYNCAAYGVY